MTQYIARAYERQTKRWIAHLETDSIDTALAQARGLMDMHVGADSEPPFTLIEVATTDAHPVVLRQWVGHRDGYHLVRGRDPEMFPIPEGGAES